MGPPSSGAVALQQMLGILEAQDLRRMGPGAEAAHWFTEAGRLAFADRALYLADPAFISVPVSGLIDRDYIRSRAGLISPERSMGRAKPGDPPNKRAQLLAPSDGIENGTSHISVVDADGNAVAMTTTIEDGFGSRLMTEGGFLLNNQLTDFSTDGANRLEPGKRPRSSMAPTLVFDRQGRLYAVLGSPGGSQIPNYVAQALLGLLEGGLTPAQIVSQPRLGSRNGPTEVERGRMAPEVIDRLRTRGHMLRETDMTSGIALVVRSGKGWIGAADPRREGRAGGE